MVVGARALVVSCALSALACSPALRLSVDLKTDVQPGVEFDTIRVDLLGELPTERGVSALRSVESHPRVADDYIEGVRVADLADLSPGVYFIRVQVSRAGGIGASTIVQVDLSTDYVATVLLVRDCLGVTCPEAGDPPGAFHCLGGRCVDPRCVTPEDPECPAPSCVVDPDCPARAACAQASCESGLCFYEARDDRCAPSAECRPDEGCVEVGPGSDAGTTDGGTDAGTDASAGDAGTDAGTDGGPACTCSPGENLGQGSCDVCYHRECQSDCMSVRCVANSGSNCEHRGGANFRSCTTGSGATGSEFCVMLGGNCNWSGSCCVLSGDGCNETSDCCSGTCVSGGCT